MSEQNEVKANILNDYRMRLIGNKTQGADRNPTMSFNIRKNRVNLTVWTNVPNDKQKGMMSVELDAPTTEVILNILEQSPQMNPGEHKAVKCLDYPWEKGGRSKELKPIGKVIIGKEKDGTIFMCLLNWDQSRPVIKFPVRPSIFNQFENSDGSPMDEATASALYAPAWARVLRKYVFQQLRDEFVPYQASQRQENNRSSNTKQQQGDLPETTGDGWGNDGWSM